MPSKPLSETIFKSSTTMNPATLSLPLLAAVMAASVAAATAGQPTVGICYGTLSDDLPPAFAVVDIVKSSHISKVRLFNPDPDILKAFKGSGVKLMIGVPDENITYISTGGVNAATQWLDSNIFAHLPASQVLYLGVGNDVLFHDASYAPHIMPAIKNLHQVLKSRGLDGKIKISSPLAPSILAKSSPPSVSTFKQEAMPMIRPLLEFLKETGAPMMVNVYPFFAYANDPMNVPLSFALFSSDASPINDDGVKYTNMYEAMLDSFVVAMEKEGYKNVPLTVTETGWPTAGGDVSGPTKAGVYNNNVVLRALSGMGTPRRPGVPVEVFLFSLLDENLRDGSEYETHFGIFNLDGSKSYSIGFA